MVELLLLLLAIERCVAAGVVVWPGKLEGMMTGILMGLRTESDEADVQI